MHNVLHLSTWRTPTLRHSEMLCQEKQTSLLFILPPICPVNSPFSVVPDLSQIQNCCSRHRTWSQHLLSLKNYSVWQNQFSLPGAFCCPVSLYFHYLCSSSLFFFSPVSSFNHSLTPNQLYSQTLSLHLNLVLLGNGKGLVFYMFFFNCCCIVWLSSKLRMLCMIRSSMSKLMMIYI